MSAPDIQRCGVLFPRRSPVEPLDQDGCTLPCGHHEEHEFVAANGRRYSWGVDMDCDCEDCQADEPQAWCLYYGQI